MGFKCHIDILFCFFDIKMYFEGFAFTFKSAKMSSIKQYIFFQWERQREGGQIGRHVVIICLYFVV